MDPEEIEELHEAAVGLYASGRYAEARRAWEAVLSAVPGDARAAEGIRMVRVLAGEWPADAPGGEPLPAGSLTDELSRVEGLLADARYGDALLAAQRASEAERGSTQARRLAARALDLFEAAPYIDVELTRAKEAVAAGRADEARTACERILSFDPHHRAATELLARASGEAPRPMSPSSAAPARPAPPATPAPASKPAAAPPARPKAAPAPATPPPAAMKTPAADAFFDITDEDLATEQAPVTPLGAPPASARAAADDDGGRHEDAVFNLLDDEVSETSGTAAVSGLKEAAGSAHHSLFEMPDEDVPTIKTSFSDLEAEIDESQGPADGEVDFDAFEDVDQVVQSVRPPSAAARSAAPATPPAPADNAADFSFAEEDFALHDGAAGVVSPGQAASPEARIAALLDESRRALRNHRFSEAIEAAARAFAIDPEAQGAQQLIDEARTRQDEADRETEETLYTARDQLTAGDLDDAEAGFRIVLKTHPSHREALDGIDQIARRRNERDIKEHVRETQAASPEKTATPVESFADVETAWPTPEPLTPKPLPARPSATEPLASPRPTSHGAATRAVKTSSGLGRRILILGAIVGVLVGLAAVGAFAITSFLGKSRPVEKAVLTPRRERKEVIKIDKVPAPASEPRKGRPDPAAFAAGVPRTIPEAKRLASEGKLEASRAVLVDMVREAPDNIAAVDALKAVQSRIVERDRAAESLDLIKRAFKQDRYEDALRMLYRLPAEMQKGDIEIYKTNAWYNNGIGYLMGGNSVEAVRSFDEALNINPSDRGAQRLRAYARTYSNRDKDSAYRIFVDGLQKRPIDAN